MLVFAQDNTRRLFQKRSKSLVFVWRNSGYWIWHISAWTTHGFPAVFILLWIDLDTYAAEAEDSLASKPLSTALAKSSGLNLGMNRLAPTFCTIASLNTPLNEVCNMT